MKKAFTVLFLALFCYLSQAQNDTAYIYTYGGIQNEVCNQIKPTWDGGYILVGTTNSFGPGNNNIYAVKVDSMGHHQWSNAYGGLINQEGYSVTPTLDKGYAFLGFTDSYGTGGYDMYLTKTDSNGKVLWQRTYGGSDWDFGYSIQQLKDSGYVMCGLTYSYGSGNGDVYIVRTDKNGDTVWTRTVGGSGYDVGNSIYVHEDSIYVIAGETTSMGADTDSYFIKINNKGTLETTRTYGITKNDAIYSIRGTMDRGFVMYGYTDSIPDSNTTKRSELMLKIDSTGKQQWMQIYYSNTFTGTGKDAIELKNGYLLSAATVLGLGSGGLGLHMQRLSSGGWWQAGPTFGGTKDEYAASIALSASGNAVYAGSTESYGCGLFDFYVVRFVGDSIVQNYILSVHNFCDTLGPAGVAQVSSVQAKVTVSPNPFASEAKVLVQGEAGHQYEFSLFDEMGKKLGSEVPINQLGHGLSQITIRKDALSAGVYMYNITDEGHNKVASGKLIVE